MVPPPAMRAGIADEDDLLDLRPGFLLAVVVEDLVVGGQGQAAEQRRGEKCEQEKGGAHGMLADLRRESWFREEVSVAANVIATRPAGTRANRIEAQWSSGRHRSWTSDRDYTVGNLQERGT